MQLYQSWQNYCFQANVADFTASPEMLKTFKSDKVYVVCSSHSSEKDSNDQDLEFFMWCEYGKYIKICLALFDFLVVLVGFTTKSRCGHPGPVC